MLVKIEDIIAEDAVRGLFAAVVVRDPVFIVVFKGDELIDANILVRIMIHPMLDRWTVELFAGYDDFPEEDLIENYDLDLNDPRASDKIRKHVEMC